MKSTKNLNRQTPSPAHGISMSIGLVTQAVRILLTLMGTTSSLYLKVCHNQYCINIWTSFEVVTSKKGSPEEALVPMTMTASSMIRLRRRKRSQLQRRTVTPPSFQCVARESSSCKLPHLFFHVVMQSKPMPEVKVRQFRKGRQDLDTDDQLSADIFELKTFLSSISWISLIS